MTCAALVCLRIVDPNEMQISIEYNEPTSSANEQLYWIMVGWVFFPLN